MSMRGTMQEAVKAATSFEFGELPDIVKPVRTKEEESLFHTLVQELQLEEGAAPDFNMMAEEWNRRHVFPTLVFKNGDSNLPGPLYLKDPTALRHYYDKKYIAKKLHKTAKDSMPGGEEGYKQALNKAHTSKHFTAGAPSFSPNIPSAPQPDGADGATFPSTTPNPLFLADSPPHPIKAPLPMTGADNCAGMVASSSRSTSQKGKPKLCANCGSRRGEKYDHPSGKNFRACTYQKDEFRDNPEGLQCTNA
jgi:hypothetical protein